MRTSNPPSGGQPCGGSLDLRHLHEDHRLYTLDSSEVSGFYFDWDTRSWAPIQRVSEDRFLPRKGTVGPGMHGYEEDSIARKDGAWSRSWAGGQHTDSTEGTCVKVARAARSQTQLRLQPSPVKHRALDLRQPRSHARRLGDGCRLPVDAGH